MTDITIKALTPDSAKELSRLTILHQTAYGCRRWIITHQQSTKDELVVCAYSYGTGTKNYPMTLSEKDIEGFHHEDDCPFMVKGW